MHLTDFAAILFDVDGTLCSHHRALDGAVELVTRIRQLQLPHAFVTNNSAVTLAQQVRRLAKAGIDAPRESIYTSGQAMADWIRARFGGAAKPRVFNFAGEQLHDELKDTAVFVDSTREPVDVVCVGSHMRENAVDFSYARAVVGLYHLRQGAELLVGCPDRTFMYDGLPDFGSGAWGELFAFAAGLPRHRVHYAGKPDPEFFLHLCERLRVPPQRCLLVGDNLESDVAGGLSVGMTTAIVLTGVATREEIELGRIRPHRVFQDLRELLSAMQ